MRFTSEKNPFSEYFLQIGPILIYFIFCFSPLFEGGTTYYPVAVIQAISLLLLIGGMIAIYRGRPYLNFRHPSFFVIFLFLLYLLGELWIGTPYQLPARQQIILFICYFMVFYFSIYFKMINQSFEDNIYGILWFMGGGEAVIGVSQFVVYHERSRGTFFNPDFFGGYLAILFCLFLGKYPFEGYRKRAFWTGSGFLILLGSGLFLAQSRGAALAWVVGTSFVLWKRIRYHVIYAWMVLILLLIIVPNPLQHRILNDSREDPYSFSRIEMWNESLLMVKDHPFGIGLEMFPYVSPQYAFPIPSTLKHYGKIAESPHNEYLRVLAEWGVPGGLLFFYLLYSYFKNIENHQENFKKKIGIVGALLVFMVLSFFDAIFHEPALMLTLALIAAFMVNSQKIELKKVIHAENVRPSVYYFFLSVFSLAVLWVIISMVMGWYFYSKGYLLIRQNQLNSARDYFEKAIFFEAGNTTYHSAMANTYFSQYQISRDLRIAEKSLEELDEAIRLNSMNGNYFKLKGMIYQGMISQNPNLSNNAAPREAAFTNYKNALKYFPYDAVILLEMGKIEAIRKNPEEALKYYNRAIVLEPNFLKARETKVMLLLRENRLEEAHNEYREMNRIYETVRGMAQTPEDRAFIGFDRELLDKEFRSFGK